MEAKEDSETSLETKERQMKYPSLSERGWQNKDFLPNTNEVIREQGVSTAGAALSVQEKVNTICSLIHNSLSDLVHCVQRVNPSTSKPELSVGQIFKAQVNNNESLGLSKQGARVGT